MANVFSSGFKSLMERLASFFNKIKIPVYVIACGVQADSYEGLNALCADIGEVSSKLIRAVYGTGGEFALRGYFTKEFFDRLGFHSAEVVGCPSLYQKGRQSPILHANKKVTEKEFRPIFNGKLQDFTALMKLYPESVFFDQDTYFRILYGAFDKIDMGCVKSLIKVTGLSESKILSEGRVKLIGDMAEWMAYIKNNPFNFAFGSRIHGNIMAILCGIPAVVYAKDSRTREMAEFFNIPVTYSNKIGKNKDLYSLYSEADYSRFNGTFSEKFDCFERFLQTHGIVSKINCENSFFNWVGTYQYEASLNIDQLNKIKSNITEHYALLFIYERLLTVYRTLRRIK